MITMMIKIQYYSVKTKYYEFMSGYYAIKAKACRNIIEKLG